MELRDVVKARRMVRSYDPDRPVPTSTLTALLELATRAPSAGFSQGWDFVVLRTPADLAIVTAVISMAQALQLRTVAEGVESPEQARTLLALGCDEAQGYHYAPGLPPLLLAADWLS